MVRYDSFRVLRGSATGAQEVRELLVAEVPTVRYVEQSELQVVIAEMQTLLALPDLECEGAAMQQ